MAVCGRCLLCGHKFSCEPSDEAIRWHCTSTRDACVGRSEHEHAICETCVGSILNGSLDGAVADLVALLERRQQPG